MIIFNPNFHKFDPKIYILANKDIDFIDENHATKHFYCYGIPLMRRYSADFIFCPDFYKGFYDDVRDLEPEEAYDHWVRLGQFEGRWPSGAMYLNAIGLKTNTIPNDFDVEWYIHENPELSGASPWRAFEHYITKGVFECRAAPLREGTGDGFLAELADAIRPQSPQIALFCYEQALIRGLGDPNAYQAHGDLHLDLNQNYSAIQSYKAAYDARPNYFWTLVNMAAAYERMGCSVEGVKYLQIASSVAPGMYFIVRNLTALRRKVFDRQWSYANKLAVAGNYRDARRTMTTAIENYIINSSANFQTRPTKINLTDKKKARIAIVGSSYIQQCKLYRVDQRLDQFGNAGLQAEFYSIPQVENFVNKAHLYDIAIFYRVPATPDIIDAIIYARSLGIVTIYEIDDLIFEENCYPPTYDSLAVFVSKEEYAGLLTGVDLFNEAMKLCEYGIASTPVIQGRMANRVSSGVCFVHPNGLGSAHMAAILDVGDRASPPASRPGPVTIVYGSGSRSHNENFQHRAAAALAHIMAAYDNVNFRIIGYLDLEPAFDKFKHRIERFDFVDGFQEYWNVISECDINIAPLTPGEFNDGKSEIKWLEAAMLALPSVVSATAVYKDVINDGVDGIIADTAQDWISALGLLISDANVRRRIGQAAKEKAFSIYGLDPLSRNIAGIVDRVLPAPTPRKPTLVIVNIFYAPQNIGGATRVVRDNIKYIYDQYSDRFNLEVFCGRDDGAYPGEIKRYSIEGINVTSVSPYFDESNGGEVSDNMYNIFSEYIKRINPDLIHFHCIQRLTASITDAARAARVPYLVTIHDGWWISDHQFLVEPTGIPVTESGNWGSQRRLPRLRRCLLGAIKVLGVSDYITELYRSRGVHNAVTCANGVSRMRGVPHPAAGSKLTLGLLGGIGLAKGSELLRRSLGVARFENLEFVVVDHARPAYTEHTENWGMNEVKIVGKIPQDEVHLVYERLHVLMAPSICIESFGLVVREALSLGRWVIASDRGAVGDNVIDGENGFVVDVSDCANLVQVLEMMNANPDRYKTSPKISTDLRTSDEQGRDLVRIYEEIIDGVTKTLS